MVDDNKTKLIAVFYLVFLLAMTWSTALPAQQSPSQPAAATPPAEPAGPTAIAATDIADEAINTNALIRAAKAEAAGTTDLETVRSNFESYRKTFTNLRNKTRHQISRGGAAPVIEAGRREWLHVEVKLDRWLSEITAAVNVIDSYLERIGDKQGQWQKTREAKAEDLPPELVKSVSDTLSAINDAESQLKSRRSDLLSLQARIGQAKAETVQIIEDQKRAIAERRRAAWSVDSPPLWRMWSQPADSAQESGDGGLTWKRGSHSLAEFLKQIAPRLAIQVAIFVVLVLLFVAIRRKAQPTEQAEDSEPGTVHPFDRPVAFALVIVLTAIIVLFPGAPPLWNSLIVMLLVIAALRLMPSVMHPSKVVWAYLIGGVVAAWHVLQALNVDTPSYRLTMMLLSGLGLVLAVLIVRSNREKEKSKAPWSGFVIRASALAAVFFAIGLLANVIGMVSLAAILTAGTLLAIFSAVLVRLGILLLEVLVNVFIQSQLAGRLGAIRKSPDVVRQTLYGTIHFLGWAVWIYIALSGYLIFDPVYETTLKILDANVTAGNLSISVVDLLMFAAVVWITFKLSRFLQFILANDILPHMHLPRGVPDAITSLTHYTIILLGFLIALTAAGFDLNRITIVLGALGVGIGFGLQNVVNNFVSGLILLFERPIKLGDVVEIDGTTAEVKHIAMRASIVQDYNGANIIVPNSDLISAKVVNWTYKSVLRRIQIAVGVKYGSDPQEVIDLLVKVAEENPGVSKYPEPHALFMNFGDSSLDFELRIWTSVDTFMAISSELRVAITKALEAADIEIPFPQRDIHVIPPESGEKPGPEIQGDSQSA